MNKGPVSVPVFHHQNMTCFGDVNMSELKMSPGFCLRNLVTLTFNQHKTQQNPYISQKKTSPPASVWADVVWLWGTGVVVTTTSSLWRSTASSLAPSWDSTRVRGAKRSQGTLLHTFYTKTKLAENHTNTKKKHHTSHISLCRSCLVVWIRCWGSSHSIFT